MSDVIIIGAGITGLSCAWRLKKLGIESTILESSNRAGGVIQKASRAVEGAISDDDTRDKILLGAAGIAVAAALGIAFQRSMNDS